MRIIKFRGKTKDKGPRWCYIDPIRWVYGNLQCPSVDGVGYYMWEKIDGCSFQVEVDSETIGQFTGLYDKDGKEIYEGDILAIDESYGDFKDYLEVRFVRGVFAFLWNGDLDDECPINSPTHEWARVVGNIHDNAELLKK
jgi:uncharacterized phage protein (TIGR01671 family)